MTSKAPPVSLATTYTLCSYGGEQQAVTAVGRFVHESDGTRAYAAYFVSDVAEQAVVNRNELIFIGAEPPPPHMVLVPILSQLFGALDQAHADLGWNGYVVGAGVLSRVLRSLSPLIGARRIVDFDETTPVEGFVDQAGPKIFLGTDANEGRLVDMLGAIPDGSLVALLSPIAVSSGTPINFYDTIHKKGLTIVGQSRDTAHRRAVAFAQTRLPVVALDVPTLHVDTDEVDVEDHGGAILDWS